MGMVYFLPFYFKIKKMETTQFEQWIRACEKSTAGFLARKASRLLLNCRNVGRQSGKSFTHLKFF
jgi:hypothetical protein